MADRQITQRVDDIDGTEATTRTPFVWEGDWYQIDLSAKNQTAFQKAMEKFVAAATKLGPAEAAPEQISTQEHVIAAPSLLTAPGGPRASVTLLGPRRGSGKDTRTEADREEARRAKAWLRANGFPVADKGALRRDFKQAYVHKLTYEQFQAQQNGAQASNGG